MNDDLKTCPFCDADSELKWFATGGFGIECSTPDCYGIYGFDTEEDAIKQWNHRPIEDALREENKKLKGALEMLSEHCEELWGVVGADEGYDYLENWYERNPREEHAEIKTKVEEALK